MQLKVFESGPQLQIVTEHAGKTITWSGRQYQRRSLGEVVDICTHINDFWSRSPIANQERIFDIYQRASDVIDRIGDPYQLVLQLRPLVNELYEIHTHQAVKHWYAWNETNIYIPPEMEDVYHGGENAIGTRDRTYLKDDYLELVYLVMLLRPMIPIWGEMIDRTSSEILTGSKEYTAFQVLGESAVMETPGIKKLLLYITHNIEATQQTAAIAVDSLGTEELPNLLLSTVLVNRICVGDLYMRNDVSGKIAYNLVVAAYKAMFSSMSSANNSGASISDQVKKKTPPTGDGPDDQSIVEGYKVTEQYASGVYLPYCVFTEAGDRYARALSPTIDTSLYEHFRISAEHMLTYTPEDCQRTLTWNFIGHITPPEIEPFLERKQLINAMALAQTWLWENGHRWLAALITARPATARNVVVFSGNSTLQKMNNEVRQKLLTYYPYNRPHRQRSRGRTTPPVIEAIDQLSDAFNGHDWLICLPEEMSQIMFNRGGSSRIACPGEIKNLLALAFIDAAEKIHGQKPVAI